MEEYEEGASQLCSRNSNSTHGAAFPMKKQLFKEARFPRLLRGKLFSAAGELEIALAVDDSAAAEMRRSPASVKKGGPIA